MPVFRSPRPIIVGTAAVLALAGCLPSFHRGQDPATMQAFSPADPALATPAQGGSAVIDALRSRQTVLPPGGTYARIADAVLNASSGAAEAELRMARLKAEARSKNWLPSIGPTVSLTSPGSAGNWCWNRPFWTTAGARRNATTLRRMWKWLP